MQGDLRPARARDRSIADGAPEAGCRPGPGAPVAAPGRRLRVERRDRPGPRRARRRARRAGPVPAAAGPRAAGGAGAPGPRRRAAAARGAATVPSELHRLRAAGALDDDQAAEYSDQCTPRAPRAEEAQGQPPQATSPGCSAATNADGRGRPRSRGSRVPDLMLTIRRNAGLVAERPAAVLRQARALHRQPADLAVLPRAGDPDPVARDVRADEQPVPRGRARPGAGRDRATRSPTHAVDRAGGIAWEYLFPFGGGRPPWVSGLAQGTAIQALSRAAVRLKRPELFDVARRALGVFRTPPPSGVRVLTGERRAHYLAYSYAPGQRIYNAFFQSLIGLHDFATFANDPLGRRLWLEGEREGRARGRARRHRLVVALPAGAPVGHRLPQGAAGLRAPPLRPPQRRPPARGDRAARAWRARARCWTRSTAGPTRAVVRRDAAIQQLPVRAAALARPADAADARGDACETDARWRASTDRRPGDAARRRPDAVWALLADTPSWPRWSGVDAGRSARKDGAPDPEGVGAQPRCSVTGACATRRRSCASSPAACSATA